MKIKKPSHGRLRMRSWHTNALVESILTSVFVSCATNREVKQPNSIYRNQ